MNKKSEAAITPRELLQKHPQLETKLQWSQAAIGQLLKWGLIQGWYDRAKRQTWIFESSVLKLVDYTNAVKDDSKVKMDTKIKKATK